MYIHLLVQSFWIKYTSVNKKLFFYQNNRFYFSHFNRFYRKETLSWVALYPAEGMLKFLEQNMCIHIHRKYKPVFVKLLFSWFEKGRQLDINVINGGYTPPGNLSFTSLEISGLSVFPTSVYIDGIKMDASHIRLKRKVTQLLWAMYK